MTTPIVTTHQPLYIPPSAQSLLHAVAQPIRLGIQGYPGTGKTTSAITAPNPIILNLDNKLGAHVGKDIPVVHIYKDSVYSVPKEEKYDAVIRWLNQEGTKLAPQQTLIIDSFSTWEDWFDVVQGKVVHLTNGGKEDGFKFWNLKGAFLKEACDAIKGLSCNSITIFHETVMRDDTGERVIGIRPMIQGRYADKLPGQFTCWFAQLIKPKVDKAGKDIPNEFDYVWQVRSDAKRACFMTTPKQPPKETMFVPSNWNFFDGLK